MSFVTVWMNLSKVQGETEVFSDFRYPAECLRVTRTPPREPATARGPALARTKQRPRAQAPGRGPAAAAAARTATWTSSARSALS